MANIKYIIEKVKQWQNFKYVKPLVCRREGCDAKLQPVEKQDRVVLVCPKCKAIQNYIPKAILAADVSVPDSLKKHQDKAKIWTKR